MKHEARSVCSSLFALWLVIGGLALLPPSTVCGQSSLTNGLVGYYPFAGDANDLSGNSNHAVVYRATLATNRFGAEMDSYVFTNRSAYIATTNSVGFPFSTNDFTVSLWLRLGSPMYSATEGVLWLFGNKKAGQFELTLVPASASSGRLSFQTGYDVWLGNTSSTTPTPTVRWATNQWYHVVVRRNRNDITIYRDLLVLGQGLAADEVRIYSNEAAPSDRQLVFGNRHPNGSSYNLPQLDDIRVYSRALSTMELQELQAHGTGLKTVLVKALKPSFFNLSVGTDYQLQIADGIGNWTNHGPPFTATNSLMVYPEYWDVADWPQVFFRLQASP